MGNWAHTMTKQPYYVDMNYQLQIGYADENAVLYPKLDACMECGQNCWRVAVSLDDSAISAEAMLDGIAYTSDQGHMETGTCQGVLTDAAAERLLLEAVAYTALLAQRRNQGEINV